MVAFLSKSDASEGFDQIVDFLNAHTIKYALVVNPTIYVSCIKQFWATATVKKVNDDVQLRALIDGKKVVVSEAIIRQNLHLDDADGVECLPNDEIFEELTRMGYEKPPPKLTFYKAFFSAQWKFLIHTLVQCLSRKFNFSTYIFESMVKNVDRPSKFLMYLRFLQVVLDHQVDDMTTHNTRYTSPALTLKVFANMRRVGKGVEIPIAPAPPFTTSASSPTDLQDPTPTPHATPPQDQPPTPHDLPLQAQPTTPHESSIPLLTILMETCSTLLQKVAELEKDKHSQALEILQLKKRVKRLKRKRSQSLQAIDADEGITLVDVETDKEVVAMDVESQERLNQEDVNAASKGVSVVSAPELVSAAEPTLFNDEDVIMTMDQTLIKLKNMAGYKIEFFKGMTYDKVRPIFEREYKKVQTLFKPDKDVHETKKKRVDDETLLQESFKKLRAAEVSGSKSTQEIASNDSKEMTEEDVQNISLELEVYLKHTKILKDMLKGFDREDLVALWDLVKEKFSSAEPSEDKEKTL
nr:hypothetical protein [Tanacetum cinerariifolium]